MRWHSINPQQARAVHTAIGAVHARRIERVGLWARQLGVVLAFAEEQHALIVDALERVAVDKHVVECVQQRARHAVAHHQVHVLRKHKSVQCGATQSNSSLLQYKNINDIDSILFHKTNNIK